MNGYDKKKNLRIIQHTFFRSNVTNFVVFELQESHTNIQWKVDIADT